MTPAVQERRRPAPTLLLWGSVGGLLGVVTAVGGGLVLGAGGHSLVRGAVLAVVTAMIGLVLVIPVSRSGAVALPLAVTLFVAQMWFLYAAAHWLRDRGPFEPRAFAAAAAVALVLWQAGVVVGLLRARTPLDPESRQDGHRMSLGGR